MKKNAGTYGLIFFLFLTMETQSQEESEDRSLHYGALTQFHFSCAASDSGKTLYGFRVRRIDFRVWQAPTRLFDWSILLGFGDFRFQILEVDANFRLNDFLKLRIGHFAPPAVRSAAPVDDLFKVPIMTFIERPQITLQWKDHCHLHAYRTTGVQIHGKILKEKLYFAFMAGNADGGQFFNTSTKNLFQSNKENGLSLWGRLEYTLSENFVTGLFYNTCNSNTDSSNLERSSFGGHILLRKNKISFMTEFIQGIKHVDDLKTLDYRGWFIEGAYRFGLAEPALRFDCYQPAISSSDDQHVKNYLNYTIGLNIYPAERIKIQVNYIIKNENMEKDFDTLKNDLFYINLQCLL